ncbi:Hypothetical_protein [Hexamita inflata]|uniref:Hypothetical_protein n=1 Tax=Hexamita inflata TaxID=28002 RepID=A0AA86VJB4_9EUKA|nr:Hypothetical protein HINF_LOCUS23563 [Hexamita inflata]CAI9968353.1 Hypothetical protein HINF_LOCUS55998 [Hexamita inflata]
MQFELPEHYHFSKYQTQTCSRNASGFSSSSDRMHLLGSIQEHDSSNAVVKSVAALNVRKPARQMRSVAPVTSCHHTFDELENDILTLDSQPDEAVQLLQQMKENITAMNLEAGELVSRFEQLHACQENNIRFMEQLLANHECIREQNKQNCVMPCRSDLTLYYIQE